MTLAEFLTTVPELSHADKLSAARAYSVTQPVFITSNTLTVYVVGAGLYDVFTDEAANVSSPVRGICLALMDRLRGQSEFNLSGTLPLGQANLQMLEALIQGLPQHADKIRALSDQLVSVSGVAVYPFANATLYDVLITLGECPRKAVTAQGSWLTVTTAADCEMHSPQVYALNNRTGATQRITSIYNVSAAGVYDCRVPPEWLGAQLAVDDAYGVIG